MFVPCPHCGFLVALIVSDFSASQRCPRCQGELRSEASPTSPTPVAPVAPGPKTSAPVIAPKPPADTAPIRTGQGRRKRGGTPSFARIAPRPRSSVPGWPKTLGVSALGLLLAVQLVLAQRNELAANARWRPVISAVCTVLWCDLPAWHEPDAYTMLARSVQPATGKTDVLRVRASFRNDARWPQPWPALVLSLSDINGQPIAARVFDASDYLDPGSAGSGSELAPGQSASVDFEIIEPALPVVAFAFDFR